DGLDVEHGTLPEGLHSKPFATAIGVREGSTPQASRRAITGIYPPRGTRRKKLQWLRCAKDRRRGRRFRLCSWRQDSTSFCPAATMQIPALGREASAWWSVTGCAEAANVSPLTCKVVKDPDREGRIRL